jgi:hypothetical protein
VQRQVREHAGRLFELTFDNLQQAVAGKVRDALPRLNQLKPTLRREFLARVDRLDRQVQEAAMLKVPRGTPVNLYANLGPLGIAQAGVAHFRYRDDPRALAEALLRMSDCPDLVEDSGHRYGWQLSDQDKEALIEFLKTF